MYVDHQLHPNTAPVCVKKYLSLQSRALDSSSIIFDCLHVIYIFNFSYLFLYGCNSKGNHNDNIFWLLLKAISRDRFFHEREASFGGGLFFSALFLLITLSTFDKDFANPVIVPQSPDTQIFSMRFPVTLFFFFFFFFFFFLGGGGGGGGRGLE